MNKMFLVSNRNVSSLGLLACLEHSIAAMEKQYDTYYPGTWLQTQWNDEEL